MAAPELNFRSTVDSLETAVRHLDSLSRLNRTGVLSYSNRQFRVNPTETEYFTLPSNEIEFKSTLKELTGIVRILDTFMDNLENHKDSLTPREKNEIKAKLTKLIGLINKTVATDGIFNKLFNINGASFQKSNLQQLLAYQRDQLTEKLNELEGSNKRDSTSSTTTASLGFAFRSGTTLPLINSGTFPALYAGNTSIAKTVNEIIDTQKAFSTNGAYLSHTLEKLLEKDNISKILSPLERTVITELLTHLAKLKEISNEFNKLFAGKKSEDININELMHYLAGAFSTHLASIPLTDNLNNIFRGNNAFSKSLATHVQDILLGLAVESDYASARSTELTNPINTVQNRWNKFSSLVNTLREKIDKTLTPDQRSSPSLKPFEAANRSILDQLKKYNDRFASTEENKKITAIANLFEVFQGPYNGKIVYHHRTWLNRRDQFNVEQFNKAISDIGLNHHEMVAIIRERKGELISRLEPFLKENNIKNIENELDKYAHEIEELDKFNQQETYNSFAQVLKNNKISFKDALAKMNNPAELAQFINLFKSNPQLHPKYSQATSDADIQKQLYQDAKYAVETKEKKWKNNLPDFYKYHHNLFKYYLDAKHIAEQTAINYFIGQNNTLINREERIKLQNDLKIFFTQVMPLVPEEKQKYEILNFLKVNNPTAFDKVNIDDEIGYQDFYQKIQYYTSHLNPPKSPFEYLESLTSNTAAVSKFAARNLAEEFQIREADALKYITMLYRREKQIVPKLSDYT